MNSIHIPAKLLIIAQSARMLTQMAVDAGFVPVAIDCYADSDTRQLALETFMVASLKLADVQPALEAAQKAHGLTHVVYGSGFEDCPETLAFLRQDWVVLGNSVEVFKQFQDKPEFFSRLAALSIPYPETVFSAPEDGDNWLAKPMRGEGGACISRYDPNLAVIIPAFKLRRSRERGSPVDNLDSRFRGNDDMKVFKGRVNNSSECYWQRLLEGESLSVTFFACNGQTKMLGFNRQWTIGGGDQPFLFAGVASHADICAEHRTQMSEWLTKLAKVYPLRGLGSLDFIVADGRCYLLEINARIPASAQLYGSSVFSRHVRACLGYLDDADVEPSPPAAYQIVYARNDMRIGGDISWPDWAADRPDGGAIIGKGQPICSIIAAGKKPRQVFELLRRRQQVIEKLLNTGS